jgi:hypothetical protein
VGCGARRASKSTQPSKRSVRDQERHREGRRSILDAEKLCTRSDRNKSEQVLSI